MTEPNTEATRSESNNERGNAPTAGQRLAAKKAAKAARKAAAKGRPVMEEAILKKASRWGEWVSEHRGGLVLFGTVLALVVALGFGAVWYFKGQAVAAAELLHEAIKTEQAALGDAGPAAGSSAGTLGDVESFADATSRRDKAIERYTAVIDRYPSTQAAHWARVLKARHLMDVADEAAVAAAVQTGDALQMDALGEQAQAAEPQAEATGSGTHTTAASKSASDADAKNVQQARVLYEAALQGASKDDSLLSIQAFEGLLYTYERQNNIKEALAQAKTVAQQSPSKALAEVSRYHQGRYLAELNQREEGAKVLAALITDLRGQETAAGSARAGQSNFLLSQAELTLLQIDASALPDGTLTARIQSASSPGGAGGGFGAGIPGLEGLGLGGGAGAGAGLEDLSPEQLQMILKQLQAQQPDLPKPGADPGTGTE